MTDVERYEHRPAFLDNMHAAWELANRLQRAKEFVPSDFGNRPEAIMAAILTGIELDVQPLWALRNIAVIKGRVSLSAEGMRALVLRAGHSIWQVEASDSSVVMAGRRRGAEGDPLRVEWTWRQAQNAKLTDGDGWKKYPRAMLTARATTELCRILFPDVIAGIMSTDEVADLDGATSTRTPSTGSASVSRRKRVAVTDADPTNALENTRDRNRADVRGDVGPERPAPGPIGKALIDAGLIETQPPAGDASDPDVYDVLLDDDGSPDAIEGQLTLDDAAPVDNDEVRDRRRFFAHMRDAFPDATRQERDTYRHALVALVTRERPAGPTVHYGDTDLAERLDLSARVADLRARRLLAATEPDGVVTFTGNNRRAIVCPPVDGAGAWSVIVEDREP